MSTFNKNSLIRMTNIVIFNKKRTIGRYFFDVTNKSYFPFFCIMKKKKVAIKKEPALEVLRMAKRLKELRMKEGFTSYEAFANEHGLSRAMYGRYEKGKDLRFSTLVKIVKAFDMTLEEFFSEGFD